jgi:hypothetical protein
MFKHTPCNPCPQIPHIKVSVLKVLQVRSCASPVCNSIAIWPLVSDCHMPETCRMCQRCRALVFLAGCLYIAYRQNAYTFTKAGTRA